MIGYFSTYFHNYGPFLVVSSLVISILYAIIANWTLIRATYRCVDLKNTLTGKVGKCFDSVQGNTCHNTDLGYIYGWCNDTDNYGPLPGSKSGPYNGECTQWTWAKDKCPPYQCMGEYPGGIGEQTKHMCGQKWGWCADKDVERAMIGTPCGPREGSCDKWLWDVKKCPTACEKAKKPKKKCSNKVNRCQTVCGNREDGNLKCPPPSCHKKTPCQDKCICTGPPKLPWKPYENKQIRIRAKDGKGKDCGMKHNGRKGGAAGISKEEKVAKFSCDESAKPDLMLLEKSKDNKYRLLDSDGCTLQWSGLKGGNLALGTDERLAKFDCGGDAGDPLELEGTPEDVRIYANIKGKKCGLQWSSVKGKVKGVTRQERVAKFDCHDQGDRMVVDMA
jgi:hypothetical protein